MKVKKDRVTPLATQLLWAHNLIIFGQSIRPEEREFCLRMAIRERWSARELEAQFRRGAFQRAVFSPPKISPLVRELRWTHNLLFVWKSKRLEQQESDLRPRNEGLVASCELDREFRQVLFRRPVLQSPKLSTAMREIPDGADGRPSRRAKGIGA